MNDSLLEIVQSCAPQIYPNDTTPIENNKQSVNEDNDLSSNEHLPNCNTSHTGGTNYCTTEDFTEDFIFVSENYSTENLCCCDLCVLERVLNTPCNNIKCRIKKQLSRGILHLINYKLKIQKTILDKV